MSYSRSYEPETYAQQGGYVQQTQPTANVEKPFEDNIPVVPVVASHVQTHGAANYQGRYPQPHPQPHEGRQRRQPPPIGRWADGICDWPANMYPSVYCVCCACSGAWIIGQMSEKVGCMKFNYTIMIYALLMLIAFIIDIAVPYDYRPVLAMSWLPAIYVFLHALALRLYIVKRHQIQECGTNPDCALFGECCWGWWCWQCSVCQMARYVYGYDKVLDGDADPHRADNWAV